MSKIVNILISVVLVTLWFLGYHLEVIASLWVFAAIYAVLLLLGGIVIASAEGDSGFPPLNVSSLRKEVSVMTKIWSVLVISGLILMDKNLILVSFVCELECLVILKGIEETPFFEVY